MSSRLPLRGKRKLKLKERQSMVQDSDLNDSNVNVNNSNVISSNRNDDNFNALENDLIRTNTTVWR